MSRTISFNSPYQIGEEIKLKCPITNDELIYSGCNDRCMFFTPKNILNYVHYIVYIPEFITTDFKITQLRIDYDKFYEYIMCKFSSSANRDLVTKLYDIAKELENLFKVNGRCVSYKLNEDKTWEKLIYISYIGYVPANTTEDEIKELIRLDDEKYKATQQKAKENGDAVTLRVFANTIPNELVTVKPM
jgi:hypothetical protein